MHRLNGQMNILVFKLADMQIVRYLCKKLNHFDHEDLPASTLNPIHLRWL